MASVSFFVRFVAILLLVVSIVYCDLVGHGKHELVDGKIVKLRGNTKIAEKLEDLKLYKNMPGSCDVEMDKDGNIILWYLKHSNTAKEGCSIDLVSKHEDDITLEFGVQHNKKLDDCLADSGKYDRNESRTGNMSAMTSNLLAFSFSLKNGEFDRVKGGYAEKHGSFCSNASFCHDSKGKCLEVADYSIGWARSEDYVQTTIQLVGENRFWTCNKRDHKHNQNNEASSDLYYNFNGKDFEFHECHPISNKSFRCFKKENIRKPELWKITDEDYTNKEYSSLFTFHILPTSSMQTSMQNIWIKCHEDADKEDCKENAAFQQCDKMFVEFGKISFKMLVPDNSVKTTEISKTESVESTDHWEPEQESSSMPAKSTEEPLWKIERRLWTTPSTPPPRTFPKVTFDFSWTRKAPNKKSSSGVLIIMCFMIFLMLFIAVFIICTATAFSEG
ncbi:unnamed protein product [Meloidogyne enterolobii]|uniref:Uncharacterized protein n=1 Tax=Meloidogyne enterolobii TaxID=390850 RepID=A0ACB0ZK23_MELEN